ncbi:conserved hypothetical protein [Bradyrhizobium sp. ORS 278]|uniref:hypothetical protein n=1 Tax=Bradyrhizobium sp. (strain ORS 278) TaxID=114615 RepID=UPI0001508A80|nr:hypothetical protein [Bradyrhizobium sp. ORS 278]CAL77650.1 conserved hypothetical protein [Bradyrhizobium sp. ORS 278]
MADLFGKGYQPRHYILVGRVPKAVDDLLTWIDWFEAVESLQVAYTRVNSKCAVSTLFLGLDHSVLGGKEPILFETMVLGGPLHHQRRPYRTWEDAERGHAAAVVQAREACAQSDGLLTGAHRRRRRANGWRKHVRKQKARGR